MNEGYNYEDENREATDNNAARPGLGANVGKTEKVKPEKKSMGIFPKILLAAGLGIVFGGMASIVFVASSKIVDRAVSIVEEKIEPEANKDNDIEKKHGRVEKEEKQKEAPKDDEIKEIPEKQEPVEKKEEKNTTDNVTNEYSYNSVADVAAASMPSIVAITTKSVQEVMSIYGFGTRQYEAEGAGSGIIIGENDNELLIVTNNHVVEGATTLTVCFIDDEVCEASVKGSAANNDLAIVAVKHKDIKQETKDKIKIAEMGDSDALVIGEQVVAIGNALGYGQSVTTGIVSALNRSIKNDTDGAEYIQTDAAINPGNSGGALLDMNGKLVGINSAKLASTQIEGMGYAIPISLARPILDGLMNLTTRERVGDDEAGYLGISGMSVNSDVARQYGMPEGIYVSEANEGGAAERAGIQKGDIITQFDGVGVNSISELRDRLNYYRAGEVVEVTVSRTDDGEYKERTIEVTLDSRKASESNQSNENQSGSEEEPRPEGDSEENNHEEYGRREYQIPNFGDYGDLFDYFFN